MAESGSIGETFNTVNHLRHTLMDLSMIGMAIGALVATGGATGFIDPVLGWLKMHVSGIPDLFTSGPEFLSSAFEQAQDGIWFTGAEADMHSMHEMDAIDHSAHADHDMTEPTEPVLSDSAKAILGME